MLKTLSDQFNQIKTNGLILLKFFFKRWGQAVLLFSLALLLWECMHLENFQSTNGWLANGIAFLLAPILVAQFFAIPSALFLSSWKVMRGWTLFFLGLWILVFFGTFTLFQGLIINQSDDTWKTLIETAQSHEWITLILGPAERIGPPILILMIPLLIIDSIQVLLNPSFLLSLLILLLKIAGITFIATTPVILLYLIFFIKNVLKESLPE